MTPMVGLMPGIPELLIILAVVLLLFGGTRLAGLGKSTGRAIKEFKDETKGLKGPDQAGTSPQAGLTQPGIGEHTEVTPVAPQVQAYPQAQPPQSDVAPLDGDRR